MTNRMECWRIALLSVIITIAVLILLAFIIAIIQTGTAEVIKDSLIDEYCSNISITEARELEVCNE
ncbi:MAG TPA: hypothetical protein IAB59_00180 [Candidatus Onthousia faecipullorum]|uniref:Uncharacterized protein n=1 Tax=Candidatus Onthousia faecipullorum TaxID=2840887 RepID=A0A9D1G972_9FIRM|nr:hypothetical protein [Candidatus Onthousia faecipullorum]